MSEKLTKKTVVERVKAMGLVCRWMAEWNEFRIALPPGCMSHVKTVDDDARESAASYVTCPNYSDDPQGDLLNVLTEARRIVSFYTRNPPPGFKSPWAPTLDVRA